MTLAQSISHCAGRTFRRFCEVGDLRTWGFTYKTNLIWYKIRKDGGPDGRGVGFYFRNVTEMLLFGIRGSVRTLAAGRRQVNIVATRKREHSRKPDEAYDLIERCSPGPYLELFARHPRTGWVQWGNEIVEQGEQEVPTTPEVYAPSQEPAAMLFSESAARYGRRRALG